MQSENKPVFSIITPTCNRPLLLRRTIESVLHQSYTNYEHIIVDDAGNKETEELVKGIDDKRIIFIQHDTRSGAGASYNSGLNIARGRYILFLDDDDEYLPVFLDKMLYRFSNSKKEIGFIWTGVSRIKDTATGEKLLSTKIWPSSFSNKEEGIVAATSIGNGYGVCIKRECIDEVGLYDESITTGQDTEYLFRLAGKFEFETIPEVLVKLHQHETSQLTNESNNLLRLQLREKILAKHNDLLMKYPKLYFVHYKVVVNLCFKLKLREKGRKTMMSIIKNTPFRFLNYTDLIFYELTGKDTSDLYHKSFISKIVTYFK
jgi:glycosyltransferase involved in cell wall biosynthesis